MIIIPMALYFSIVYNLKGFCPRVLKTFKAYFFLRNTNEDSCKMFMATSVVWLPTFHCSFKMFPLMLVLSVVKVSHIFIIGNNH